MLASSDWLKKVSAISSGKGSVWGTNSCLSRKLFHAKKEHTQVNMKGIKSSSGGFWSSATSEAVFSNDKPKRIANIVRKIAFFIKIPLHSRFLVSFSVFFTSKVAAERKKYLLLCRFLRVGVQKLTALLLRGCFINRFLNSKLIGKILQIIFALCLLMLNPLDKDANTVIFFLVFAFY